MGWVHFRELIVQPLLALGMAMTRAMLHSLKWSIKKDVKNLMMVLFAFLTNATKSCPNILFVQECKLVTVCSTPPGTAKSRCTLHTCVFFWKQVKGFSSRAGEGVSCWEQFIVLGIKKVQMALCIHRALYPVFQNYWNYQEQRWSTASIEANICFNQLCKEL